MSDHKSKAQLEIVRLQNLLLSDDVKENPRAKAATIKLIEALKKRNGVK